MHKTKVRFHLAKGEHFMFWQIKHPYGKIDYVNPKTHSLGLLDTQLKNQPKAAQKIYDGANKSVCAWIECDKVEVVDRIENMGAKLAEVSFNPRVQPNWVFQGENADGRDFIYLYTINNKVFSLGGC